MNKYHKYAIPFKYRTYTKYIQDIYGKYMGYIFIILH